MLLVPLLLPTACTIVSEDDDDTSSDNGLAWGEIPGGHFAMGCSPGDAGCFDNKNPSHNVVISAIALTGVNPNHLADCPLEQAWDMMHQALMWRHSGKIKEEPRGTFNGADTAVRSIAIVYASTIEYVAFFGTPIGHDGFSGCYNPDDRLRLRQRHHRVPLRCDRARALHHPRLPERVGPVRRRRSTGHPEPAPPMGTDRTLFQVPRKGLFCVLRPAIGENTFAPNQ